MIDCCLLWMYLDDRLLFAVYGIARSRKELMSLVMALTLGGFHDCSE